MNRDVKRFISVLIVAFAALSGFSPEVQQAISITVDSLIPSASANVSLESSQKLSTMILYDWCPEVEALRPSSLHFSRDRCVRCKDSYRCACSPYIDLISI